MLTPLVMAALETPWAAPQPESAPAASVPAAPEPPAAKAEAVVPHPPPPAPAAAVEQPTASKQVFERPERISVQVIFEPNLPLPDMKARLVLNRLASRGRVLETKPSAEQLDVVEALTEFTVWLTSECDPEELRRSPMWTGWPGSGSSPMPACPQKLLTTNRLWLRHQIQHRP